MREHIPASGDALALRREVLNVESGLFRGGAGSVSVAVQGPACLLAGDIDGNGTVNFADLNLVLANFGTQYTFQDLNNVLASFGLSC